MKTRTLKFKTTEASCGLATLQHPNAPLGHHGQSITYEVVDIPGSVSDREVARLFNASCPVTINLTFAFSELGVGHLVRGIAAVEESK